MVHRKCNWYNIIPQLRDVAQLGRAPALGAGSRRFKSGRPDFFNILSQPQKHLKLFCIAFKMR